MLTLQWVDSWKSVTNSQFVRLKLIDQIHRLRIIGLLQWAISYKSEVKNYYCDWFISNLWLKIYDLWLMYCRMMFPNAALEVSTSREDTKWSWNRWLCVSWKIFYLVVNCTWNFKRVFFKIIFSKSVTKMFQKSLHRSIWNFTCFF